MKKMIEEGTLYDEMTPEQKEMHEEIKSLIDNLETLSAMWSEMINTTTLSSVITNENGKRVFNTRLERTSEK